MEIIEFIFKLLLGLACLIAVGGIWGLIMSGISNLFGVTIVNKRGTILAKPVSKKRNSDTKIFFLNSLKSYRNTDLFNKYDLATSALLIKELYSLSLSNVFSNEEYEQIRKLIIDNTIATPDILLVNNSVANIISTYSKKINKSKAFKYFNSKHGPSSNETFAVKEYYSYLFAITIFSMRNSYNSRLIPSKIISTKDLYEIFLNLTKDIREEYITTELILFGITNNRSYGEDSVSFLSFFNTKNIYETEIKKSLISDEPFFIEEWNESEIDPESGIEYSGKKIYYSYVRNLLLTSLEENSWGYAFQIKEIEPYELDEQEFSMLSEFVKFIRSLIN